MSRHVYCVAAFSDAKAAITAQRVLAQGGMDAPMMPTPREITASCGLSLRVPLERLEQAAECLKNGGLGPEMGCVHFYHMEYDACSRTVTPISPND